jgi:uncharacterized protein YrrD
MLRNTSAIKGSTISASDGPMGSVSDLLFDDESWRVRWLVVDTGVIFPGRKVLLPPSILGAVNHIARQFSVRLTKAEVGASPDIDSDAPVSRHMEREVYDHYGWSPYWTSGFYMGGYGYGYGGGAVALPLEQETMRRDAVSGAASEPAGDKSLRSVSEVTGYHIHARDGEIGHVSDVLVEDGDWTLRYLAVATHNWWPGKTVLISPHSVTSIDWATRIVTLDVDRESVRMSPAYDASKPVDRAYETAFHGHYSRASTAAPAPA